MKMPNNYVDQPMQVDLFQKGYDAFGQNPLVFSGAEINKKVSTMYESDVPSNFIQDGDIIVRLNVIDGYLQSDGFVTGSTGWRIDSDGNTEFASGYFRGDITGATGTFTGEVPADSSKLDKTGGTYSSADVGARVRIFPDSSIGIQITDDASADVFRVNVGGTDVGDVIIGDYANNTGVKWDKSVGTFTVKGSLITGSGSTINGIYVDSLTVDKLAAGTITSKTVTLAIAAGTGDVYFNAGKTDFINTDSGFILGLDDSDLDKAKFFIGDSTHYFNWDGTNLTVLGGTITGGIIQTSASGNRLKLSGADNQLQFLTDDTVVGYLTTSVSNDVILDADDDVMFSTGGTLRCGVHSSAFKPANSSFDIGASGEEFRFGYFNDLKVQNGYTGDVYVATTDGGSPTKKLDIEDGIVYDR